MKCPYKFVESENVKLELFNVDKIWFSMSESELLVKLRLFGLLSLLGIHKLDKKKLIFEDLSYESSF